MNDLKNLLQEFENTILAQKETHIKERKSLFSFVIVMFTVALATVISIIWLPYWMSIILVLALVIFVYIEKLSAVKRYGATIDRISKETNILNIKIEKMPSTINNQISNLELEEKQKIIDSLNQKVTLLVGKLKAVSAETASTSSVSTYNTDGGYIELFLHLVQNLDFEVDDFGEKCANYIREQFSKTLQMCGLKFVNYSKETSDYFSTERTNLVTKPNCTARAIVTKKTPTTLILPGHAFIPEN